MNRKSGGLSANEREIHGVLKIYSIAELLQTELRSAVEFQRGAVNWLQAPPPTAPTKLFAESRLSRADRLAGIVRDASGTVAEKPVSVIAPTTEWELREAVAAIRKKRGTLSISGTRHASGNQALVGGAHLIDMRGLNGMTFAAATNAVTVQAGATWADVQRFLDPMGRSLAVAQSSNVFSVGGSIATNIHGRDVRFGPLIDALESVRLLMPDGRLLNASRAENPKLFSLAVGGYGQFGVVTDATIKTVSNELMRRTVERLDMSKLSESLDEIVGRDNQRLLQVRLSTVPGKLFADGYAIHLAAEAGITPALHQEGKSLTDAILNVAFEASVRSRLGKRIFWSLQGLAGKTQHNKVISRNQEMSPAVEFLRSSSHKHRQVLHEMFVPKDNLESFLAKLKTATESHDANLLNVTLRWMPKDTQSALPYAQSEGWAAVLYLNQLPGDAARAKVDAYVHDVAQAAVSEHGSFYLPYSLDGFSAEQVAAAYPQIGEIRAAETVADPDGLISGGLSGLHTQ